MKKRILLIVVGVLVISAGGLFFIHTNGKTVEKTFQFAEITRQDVINTVYCSGTLNAVGTVEVGTQVSGVIDHIYVDFNDRVKKNQILAVLDSVTLKAQVLDARANYDRVLVQLEEAKANHSRNLPLYEKGLISEAEYLPYKFRLKTQKAALKSAEASVMRSERNLKYAVIRSPISGTVIQRNIEEGQTVAASLQAPTLFIIAEDLSKMEIHAQVDESDIGQIKEGQTAKFEVQSYPDEIFEGTVRQVRLQPQIIQNVVNYTVVIDAKNKEGLLLPGMTATIDFYVDEKRDVLTVPNAALNFQPSEQMFEAFRAKRRKQFENIPDSVRQTMMAQRRQLASRFGENMRNRDDVGTVWYLNDQGEPDMARLRTGTTDGKLTEIVASRQLEKGDQVIIDFTEENKEIKRAQAQRPMRGFRRGPF